MARYFQEITQTSGLGVSRTSPVTASAMLTKHTAGMCISDSAQATVFISRWVKKTIRIFGPHPETLNDLIFNTKEVEPIILSANRILLDLTDKQHPIYSIPFYFFSISPPESFFSDVIKYL